MQVKCKVCDTDINKRFYHRHTNKASLCKKCLQEITAVVHSKFIYGEFRHSPVKLINDIAYKSYLEFVRNNKLGGE